MPVEIPIYPNTEYPDKKVGWLFEELPEEFREKVVKGERITGKEVRRYLKRLFPKGKFRIKVDYSLRVVILGGAGRKEVERALMKFETSTFNPMIDYSGIKIHTVLMPDGSLKEIRFNWNGISVEVDWKIREALIEKALEKIHKKYPGNTKDEIREMFLKEAIELAENELLKEL